MAVEFIEDVQREYELTYRLYSSLVREQEKVANDLIRFANDQHGWRELHEAEFDRLADEIAAVSAVLRLLEDQCP